MNDRRLVILILSILGSGFVCLGGGLFGILIPYLSENEIRRVEGTSLATAVEMQRFPPGQPVVIEGRLSPNSPTRFREFVAYERYELEEGIEEDEWEWKRRERVTPPLVVELPDGTVQITNETYTLFSGHIYEPSSESYYKYLQAGDEVLVLGTIAVTGLTPQVEADTVALGNRAAYVAEQRGSVRFGRLFGGLFAGLGGLALLVALVLAVKSS